VHALRPQIPLRVDQRRPFTLKAAIGIYVDDRDFGDAMPKTRIQAGRLGVDYGVHIPPLVPFVRYRHLSAQCNACPWHML
jgi:hypothetical protein